jgi:solute carrier family 35 protein E1
MYNMVPHPFLYGRRSRVDRRNERTANGYSVYRYLSSALSNTSSKTILNALDQPVTLTIVQFGFVSSWCMVLALLAKIFPALGRAIPGLHGGLRYPSRQVIMTTAPLAFFQVGGHITSSIATSKIPVSLVHTIKVRFTFDAWVWNI